jgi:hypothetical protein
VGRGSGGPVYQQAGVDYALLGKQSAGLPIAPDKLLAPVHSLLVGLLCASETEKEHRVTLLDAASVSQVMGLDEFGREGVELVDGEHSERASRKWESLPCEDTLGR